MRFWSALFILLFASHQAFAQLKTAEVTVAYRYEESLQSIVVTMKNWRSTQGKASLFERKTIQSKWKAVGESFPVVVGKNGTAWGTGLHSRPSGERFTSKVEGDGKSPAGIFMLTAVFGTAANPANLKVPYTPLVESTECIDDVESHHYNKIVDRNRVGIFDWNSSEQMLAVGEQYALGVFVAHNSAPVIKGNGSCIFLHIWKSPTTGTAGCTAMERASIERIFGWIDAKKKPVLIQLPENEYALHQKLWKLPKIK